ncbi:MAG: hypothetical protein LC799_17715 [Actinobacteria bacterium]|nr:hypothetical protein [Actinomycetota bacterium]
MCTHGGHSVREEEPPRFQLPCRHCGHYLTRNILVRLTDRGLDVYVARFDPVSVLMEYDGY